MHRPRPFQPLRSLFAGVGMALGDPQVRLLMGMTLSVIGVATVFYRFVEGWTFVDAAYFATVTIATVGYGDFAPQTVAGKLFTIGYVLVGIGLFVAAGTALADHLIRRARQDGSSGPRDRPDR